MVYQGERPDSSRSVSSTWAGVSAGVQGAGEDPTDQAALESADPDARAPFVATILAGWSATWRWCSPTPLTGSPAPKRLSSKNQRWAQMVTARKRRCPEASELADSPPGRRARGFCAARAPPPRAQLSFTNADGHRFQAILTDLAGDHSAPIESKDFGFARCPSPSFGMNAVWPELVFPAHDLSTSGRRRRPTSFSGRWTKLRLASSPASFR
jgi:hypothetical protein